MKVALVQPKFDGSGGAESYALKLAEGLAARGHEVHAFARKVENLDSGVMLHKTPSLPFGRSMKTWSFGWSAQHAVARRRFDIVQGSGKTWCQSVHRTGGGVHRAYVERRGGLGRAVYDRVAIALEDRLFRSPGLRAVICPSRWARGEVVRFYPALEGRCRVIANGVDTGAFAPAGREASRQRLAKETGVSLVFPVLLFVATNFRLKGLGPAIQALSLLPEAQLLVVGGDQQRPWRDQAAELGLNEHVHFVGAHRDMEWWYRGADLLIHPTEYDPFANVCLEALACGCPVVTTDRNGVADLLGAGEAGRVVGGPADPAALATEARSLLALGERARAAARSLSLQYAQPRHLDAVEALYRELGEHSR
ncbi:MAG: glycosyltransferase family 4 protein [Deferrisomatales bacterium]|nr:glycosyltransferase family 4 protein [Deferrisomatales bacterium]